MRTQEINTLKIEANIFCRHKTLRDYFFYRTEYTISQILLEADDHFAEMDMVFEDLLNYTDNLLEQLVHYELFELCTKVKDQTERLGDECHKALKGIHKINQSRL